MDRNSATLPADVAPSDDSKTVVLIFPKTGIDLSGVSIFLPLSILSIASSLTDAGFSCVVIDMRVDSKWKRTLKEALLRAPLYVGISAMTGRQIHWGLKAANVVRRITPSIPIVWGGTHASVLPEETLGHGCADAVVVGRGEEHAIHIATLLAKSPTAVNGRIFRAPKAPTGIHPSNHRVDFERYPPHPYFTPVVRDIRGPSYATSRGCPHKCAYCYNKAVHGSAWTAEPSSVVLEHLTVLHALGAKGVVLFEDNFFVNQRRVEETACGLIERGLNLAIKADCRADYIARYSDDFLKLIRRAGFEMLYIGAESGSDRILESMNKGVDVQTLIVANRRLAEADIRPHYSFMAGLPGETVQDMRATVDLMIRLKTDHPGAYLSPVKAYVPYPGTDLYEVAVAAGFKPPKNLEEWSAYDWNNRPAPWLGRAEARYIEKMTYVTSGLDPSAMELAGLNHNRLASWGFLQFSKLCKKRCKLPTLGLIPEMPIVRFVKRHVSS